MKRFLLLLMALMLLPLNSLGEQTVSWKGTAYPADTEYIELTDEHIDIRELIGFLVQFPQLKKVDMFSSPVTGSQIDELTGALPQVTFGWTMKIPCKNPVHPERNMHLIRTDALVFSTLHNNQCTQHTTKELSILKYCTQMLALDIGHNAVDDLSFLESMPSLRVLIIGRNHVTDLSPLAHCPDLEYLEAFTNNITSVAPLLQCTHLMDLNIPNNQVRDPELFAQMKSLKKLWAFNYAWKDFNTDRVPGSVKQLIRQALPDCKVNWDQAGTNGWREDAHYPVIYEMFNTGVYIPFADGLPDITRP